MVGQEGVVVPVCDVRGGECLTCMPFAETARDGRTFEGEFKDGKLNGAGTRNADLAIRARSCT